jgi:predicted GNAT family N-acyltransferase
MDQVFFEKVSKSHKRKDFDCGVYDLSRFLHAYAIQNEKKNRSRTFVMLKPDDRTILGYFTLASFQVDFEDCPEELKRKLPKYPLPVALIGRLAVDSKYKSRGYGKVLLVEALRRSWLASQTFPIHAVVTHAKDSSVRNFYLKFGFKELLDDSRHLYIPLSVISSLTF